MQNAEARNNQPLKDVIHRGVSWRGGKKVCLHLPLLWQGCFCTMQPCIKVCSREWTRGGEGCNGHGLLIEVFYRVGCSIALSALRPAEPNQYFLTEQTGTSQTLLGLFWFCGGLFLFGCWGGFFFPLSLGGSHTINERQSKNHKLAVD